MMSCIGIRILPVPKPIVVHGVVGAVVGAYEYIIMNQGGRDQQEGLRAWKMQS
jgi:hypothetical protein